MTMIRPRSDVVYGICRGLPSGVMFFQTLPVPVGTTFDTIPRFVTSMTLLHVSRAIDTFAFVNNKHVFLEKYSIVKEKIGEI